MALFLDQEQTMRIPGHMTVLSDDPDIASPGVSA